VQKNKAKLKFGWIVSIFPEETRKLHLRRELHHPQTVSCQQLTEIIFIANNTFLFFEKSVKYVLSTQKKSPSSIFTDAALSSGS
jgi:hypothetical protein